MGRNHIHFASGLPAGFTPFSNSTPGETAEGGEKEATAPVISGMRKNSSVLVYVDIDAALAAGIKFFLSENGVILTEGDEKGLLSYEFFKRVESRKAGGGVLMSGGKLPDGVAVDAEAWEREVGDGQKGRRGGRGGSRGGRGGKARAVNETKEATIDV